MIISEYTADDNTSRYYVESPTPPNWVLSIRPYNMKRFGMPDGVNHWVLTGHSYFQYKGIALLL